MTFIRTIKLADEYNQPINLYRKGQKVYWAFEAVGDSKNGPFVSEKKAVADAQYFCGNCAA